MALAFIQVCLCPANLSVKTFPSRADYIAAVEKAANFVLDPVLKRGRPRTDRNGQPLIFSGGFTSVFVIDCRDKAYALRCWISDIGDAAHRYQVIGDCLDQVHLPWFVDFAYESEGILVNGKRYPTLRMEWVEALSLHDFIGKYRHQRQVLTRAAENFLAMAQTLHKRKIAHGDLQSDNLKLRMNGAGPEFVLIDYDTLFVPGLAGAKATNAGVAGFQHPARAQAALASAADDYFSELVIYLTLRAVAEEPQLWDDYQMANREKELIFDAEDFHSSAPTERFRRLRNLSPPVGKLTLILWNYTRCGDIRWLLPIEEAAKLCCVCNITASKRSLQARKPKSEDWLTEWSSDGAPRALPPARVRGPSPLAGRSFKDLLCPGQNPTSGMGTMPTSSRETARPMRVLVFWGRLLLALVTLLIILNSPLRPRRDGGSAKPETTPSTVFPHDLPNRPTPEGISTRNNERKGGKIKVHRKQKGGRNRAYSD